MPRAQPPPTAIRKPRVAVLLLAYATFTRRILDGVAAYAREHGPWQLQTGPHAGFEPIGDLAGWQGDAIIATLSSPQRAEEVLSLGIPTVNISSAVDDFGGPSVWVDNVGIGRTAAEHLLGQGYAHFAYAGEEERVFAASRLDGFNARLSEAGHTARSILAAPGALQDRDAWIAYRRRLADFVRELPKPCGLLACDDYHANIVMQACDQAGAHVPNEVGLIGVNDDDLICHLTDPPLSSIPLSGREIGRRAAELVDQMLRGEPIAPGRHTSRTSRS